MKYVCIRLFLLLMATFSLSVGIQAQDTVPAEQSEESSEASTPSSDAIKPPETDERPVPNTEQRRIADLKAQYPPNELKRISSNTGEFTALWKKGRKGTTFGALLIVPTDGQTANWPHTIETLRTELPEAGWGTLSIDVAAIPKKKPPSRPEPADLQADNVPDESSPNTDTETEALTANTPADDKSSAPSRSGDDFTDPNIDRIKAAIEFLHQEGQYNIVLAGYGHSAKRVLEYIQESGATGMDKNMKSTGTEGMKRPIRAIIMVNPKSSQGTNIEALISSITFTDMPMLDVVVGTHYLDRHSAEARKQSATHAGMETYLQVHLMEPNTVVFGNENRLSRRIRGFMTKYAKGVEIGKGS